MKLWHAAQWGNKEEGANGWDTQCVVAAIDLNAAIEKAQLHFTQYGDPLDPYREGKADVIYMLGDDGKPDGEARLVIRIWVAFADNLGRNPSWYRKYWGDGTWATEEEVYPDYT